MFTEHEHGPVPMTDMGIVPSDDNDDDGDDKNQRRRKDGRHRFDDPSKQRHIHE